MSLTRELVVATLVSPADPRQFEGAACAGRDPRIFDDVVPEETPVARRARQKQAAQACGECLVDRTCLVFGVRNGLDGWFGGRLLNTRSRRALERAAAGGR
jgi:hypothetical protein